MKIIKYIPISIRKGVIRYGKTHKGMSVSSRTRIPDSVELRNLQVWAYSENCIREILTAIEIIQAFWTEWRRPWHAE
jgi:hypothetical protein